MLNYSDAPYFVDFVQETLVEKLGDEALAQGRYKVFTSLVMDLQQAAFEALRQGIAEMDAHFAQGKRAIPAGTVQASLIAVDPRNGDILAMVGGRHYGTTQFHRITQAKRQPGSIFKPFVYTAAIESAYTSANPLTAVSTALDQPTEFAFEDLLYEPKNFKDENQGQVTMRQAITKSLNVATIKFAEKVGYDKIAGLCWTRSCSIWWSMPGMRHARGRADRHFSGPAAYRRRGGRQTAGRPPRRLCPVTAE